MSMAGISGVNNPSCSGNECVRSRESASCLDVEAWMPSELKAIEPLVDRLVRLVEGSQCVRGEELHVELAFREALSNAVVHGNRLDPAKLVQVRCRCEMGKGVYIVVKDQGQGFDPNAVPDPLAPENLEAEHGRGMLLMKFWMDAVFFKQDGTEVHMWKSPPSGPKTEAAK
jgi:serine/threonine-protein kinase RsbW